MQAKNYNNNEFTITLQATLNEQVVLEQVTPIQPTIRIFGKAYVNLNMVHTSQAQAIQFKNNLEPQATEANLNRLNWMDMKSLRNKN